MRIVCNGKDEELAQGTTIAQLIADKGINQANVVVEHNYTLVKSDRWSEVVLQENDRLEILRLVGGG